MATEWAAGVAGACDGISEHCSDALKAVQARTAAAAQQLVDIRSLSFSLLYFRTTWRSLKGSNGIVRVDFW